MSFTGVVPQVVTHTFTAGYSVNAAMSIQIGNFPSDGCCHGRHFDT